MQCGFADLEKGIKQLVVFPTGHFSSHSGEQIDCNLKAHYRRVEERENAQVIFLPFMKLVRYNFQNE